MTAAARRALFVPGGLVLILGGLILFGGRAPLPHAVPDTVRNIERGATETPLPAAEIAAQEYARTPAGGKPDGDVEIVGDGSFQQIFGVGNVAVTTPAGQLSFALQEVRIGGRSLVRGGGVRPDREGDAVVYRRGGVTEKYIPKGGGAIEQVFVLDRGLESLKKAGDLRIDVSLNTDLTPAAIGRPQGEGGTTGSGQIVEFRDPDGATVITYGSALAIDASGRRQPLRYALEKNVLAMTLDAGFLASADFPLTIDPLIGSNFAIDYTAGLRTKSDVAYSPTAGAYLVVYQNNATDIYCRSVSSSGAVGTKLSVDVSTDESISPRVARSDSNQFLVVWSERTGTGSYRVMGQFVLVSGNVPTLSGSQFTIDDTGLDSINPDVGFCRSTGYYLVAFELGPPLNHDIKARCVTQTAIISPLVTLDASTAYDEKPTVSPYFTNPMGVAWVHRVNSTAQGDIESASMNTSTLAVSAIGTASNLGDNEDDPDLGSGTGASACYLVWARQVGTNGHYDIYGKRSLFYSTGPVFGNLAYLDSNPLTHVMRPRCDAVETVTGKRLIVTYAENSTYPPTQIDWSISEATFDTAADPPTLLERVTRYATAGSQPKEDYYPCVAVNAAAMEALTVWDNDYSEGTRDVWGQRVDIALVPGFYLTASSVTTWETGTQATFRIKLKKQPTADVTIGISSSDTSEGTVSPASLTFTSANWNTYQTVWVTGVDDFVDDGNIAYTVVTAPASSADPGYSGLDPDNVAATNMDNDTAGISVSQPSGPLTSEFGVAEAFTVVLTSQPTANVTIPITSSDTSEGTVEPASIAFTSTNWNTPQVVRVYGADDSLVDGPIPYTVQTDLAVSADPLYSGMNASDISLSNIDNDAAGITVASGGPLSTWEGGGWTQFAILLNTVPTANVTINLSSSDLSEGTVSPASLTFTPANALSPQFVTVMGADDSLIDGAVGYSIITAPAISADTNYSGLNAQDLDLTNGDNDWSNILVTPTGLSISEGGSAASFTVALATTPTADVTIGIASQDPTQMVVAPASLTFTPANALTPQTVTVVAVDDGVSEGLMGYWVYVGAASSADANYKFMDPPDVQVMLFDNEFAGIVTTPLSDLYTTEAGGTASFQLLLTTQPTADVIIPLWSTNVAEGTVLIDAVTFTLADWNSPKTVTVTGVDDSSRDGDWGYNIMTDPAISADPQYSGLDSYDAWFVNKDDDEIMVSVSPFEGVVTTEAGGTATFDVVLKSKPSADVSFSMYSSDTSEGSVSPSSLTFTSANWSTPQVVTVTGANDYRVDRNLLYIIVTSQTTSTDPNWNGMYVPDVFVTNNDNDVAGFVFTPPGGLTTTEAGGTATFNVRLRSQPTDNVTLPLSSSDLSEGTVSPASLTFTPVSWNTDQIVTVTGVDDPYDDGDIPYAIVTGAASSTDPDYNGLNPANVGVTNLDDDIAGVTVSAISGPTSENGGTATFTVVLNVRPTADVTIPLSSSDGTEGSVSPASLVFTNLNWSAAQTVTVTGLNDVVTDPVEAYWILTGDPTSADPAYDALTAANVANVAVTNDDNEPEITVTATDATASEPGADTGTFTFTRTGSTVAALTVNYAVSGTATSGGVDYTALSGSVTIPIGSLSATVTVTPLNDFFAEPDETVILTLAAGVYTIKTPDTATVTITDNDFVGVSVSAISGPTSESGGTATFTVQLTSQPSAIVEIPLTSSNTFEGTVLPSSLTFTPVSWNMAQTVTVTGVNDTVTDGGVVYTIVTGDPTSADPAYAALTAADVADVGVTNDDNEPEVTVTATDATAAEPGADTGTFTFTRTGSTAAALTVNFTVSGTATSDVDYWSIGISVTIPIGAASATVTVTPKDNLLIDGPRTVVVTVAAAGTYTVAMPNSATVTIADNDVAGVTVSGTSGPTTENGGTSTFTVVLNTQPAVGASVVIPLSSSNLAEGTVSPASLTFTSGDWSTPHTVTVTGVNDTVTDGGVVYTIVTGDPTSALDASYDALTAADVADVAMINTDNEPEMTASATDNAASEPGANTGTFTFTRTGSTAAALTVNFTVTGTATSGTDYTSIGTSVTIPIGASSVTATVTAINDMVMESNETVTVALAAGSYTIKTPNSGTVTISDDDTAGATVSAISGPTTESGGTATFTVVLTSKPTANVTIPLFSSNLAEGTVSPASLTFTSANWNVAQTVTVTGVNDTTTDGSVGYTIMTGDPSSGDPFYNVLTAASVADVAVANSDNEPEVTVTATDATASEPGADTGTFSFTRTGSTAAALTINYAVTGTATSGTDFSALTGSTTIPIGSSSATITVSPINDVVAEVGETVIVTLSAGSYTVAAPSSGTVTINDDDVAGATVSAISGSTTENGGTATFTVVLNTQPTADVTIPLSSSNLAEGTVLPASLTFTSGDWNVPQIVTVKGVNDTTTDGSVGYTIVTGDPTSADPLYDALTAGSVADVGVTNNDNEPEVSVAATDGAASEPGTDTGGFTVTRTGSTAAALTVNFTVSGTAISGRDYAPIGTSVQIPVGASSAIVTITPIDDYAVESAESVILTLTAGSYTLVAPQDATVMIADNDVAGVTVSAISGPTTESGDTATFTIRLTSQPAADVAISLTSSNTAEGTVSPASLTFTPGDWSISQTVTVTGVNDSETDGNISYTIQTGDPTSADPVYSALTDADVADVPVTNIDNEPEISITATAAAAWEQGPLSGTFTVTRTGSTAQPLVVGYTVGGTATSVTDYDSIGTSVTIPAGASSAEIVVVPVDDVTPEPTETVVVTLSSGSYTLTAPTSATITIADNDTAGFTVTPTGGLVTTEGGVTASFTIALNSLPTADVTVSFATSDATEGATLQSSVTFTPANAFVPQTVTIRGNDDTIIDGSVAYTIVTGAAVSADPAYSGLYPPDVEVTNSDDDVAGFQVNPTSGLVTTEGGGKATFSVALASTPTAKVTIALSSSNTAEGTVSPSTLTFLPANALSAQTVTVTGVNDFLVDGGVGYTILTGAASSIDPAYSGLDPANVSVTNNDDDVVGFDVIPVKDLFTNESGSTATFTVALKTIPSADVTIAVSSSNAAEGTASPASLAFTAANALMPQTVTITGVDDAVADGNAAYSIVLAAAASTDTAYDNLDPSDVEVTNVDNETAAVTVQPSSGLTTTETGGTATFNVVLSTAPTGDVTISLSSSDTTEGTVSPASLTFTAANALTPQEVTITGVNDTVVDGDVEYFIVTGAAVSTDGAYNGVNPSDVSVTNEDDDVTKPAAIGLSTASIQFTAGEGGSSPATQNLTLSNTGEIPMDWTAAVTATWLTANPVSGTLDGGASQVLSLSVDITGLTAGTFTDVLTVTGTGATNSPQMISVTLTITPPPPVVTIDAPTTSDTTSTANASIDLGGAATNSPTSVTWTNAATGESGTGTGSGTWTATVPLIAGDNLITIYGWNAGGNGSDAITVTFTAETTPPVVSTASAAYAASSPTFTLDGSASDAGGIASVAWLNATTGVRGTPTGTVSWSGSIPLTGGKNTVVITATDTVGNEGTCTVEIEYTSPVDTIPPSILITSPTSEPAYTSSAQSVVLGGVAADGVGVSSVSWLNDATGGRGVAEGTTAWSASVPLATGNNVVRLTATDPSGNAATALIVVTFRPAGGDNLVPIVAVATPTTAASFTSTTAAVDLGGVAADNVALGSVVWSNAVTGESGTAEGLAFWKASVPLAVGTNVIAIEAYDTSGNSSMRLVTIEYRIPPPPPNNVMAGHCGSIGLDLLLPLGLLVVVRRALRRRRR